MIMIDSNVILDIITQDPKWSSWSQKIIQTYCERQKLLINAIIYAEVSINFEKIEDLEEILSNKYFECAPISLEVAFLAGKCFVKYKRNGGHRPSPLPDFFIGAHASILGIPLITRDPQPYKTYFPKLKLVYPETARVLA